MYLQLYIYSQNVLKANKLKLELSQFLVIIILMFLVIYCTKKAWNLLLVLKLLNNNELPYLKGSQFKFS